MFFVLGAILQVFTLSAVLVLHCRTQGGLLLFGVHLGVLAVEASPCIVRSYGFKPVEPIWMSRLRQALTNCLADCPGHGEILSGNLDA